jgi:hypothetical protein
MKNAEKEHTGKANKKPYGNENNIKHGQSKTVSNKGSTVNKN